MKQALSKAKPEQFPGVKQREIQKIIEQLKNRTYVDRKKLLDLIQTVGKTLQHEPNMLTIQSPVTVIGDIHGQFYDLLAIFDTFGSPAKTKYLFLGDYVDRGAFNVEVMTILLAYKILYPQNVYLLRGNHQCRILTTNFNFKEECNKKYDHFVYDAFMELFDLLPLCAVIDQMYFAVHAGISPETSLVNEIQKLNRFQQIPEKGVICDLLWSDPVDDQNSIWEANKMRSCSYFYSPIQASRFLNLNNIKMIVRGHEVQMKGYKYQEGKEQRNKRKNLTLTVFSAPNYCDTYKNEGAILLINKDQVKIKNFKWVEHPIVLANYMNVIEWSLPFVATSVGKMFASILKNRSRKRGTVILEKNEWNERLSALQRIDLINNILCNKMEDHEALLEEMTAKEEDISIETTLQTFLLKKYKDFNQKRPQTFGPKIYQPKKFIIRPDEDEPLE